MALLDTGETETGDDRGGQRPFRARGLGVVLGVLGVVAELTWLAWRVTTLPVNPVGIAVLAAEVVGLAGTLAITVGLARSRRPRGISVDDRRDSHRFAFAVADIVGRTRSTDVHRDVVRVVRTAPHRRPRRSAEAAMGAVLLEGPRRLVLVGALSIGLVVGLAPMRMPPTWAIGAAAVAAVLAASSHVVLGGGRIRFGDRTRWSYSSIGEVVAAADLDGVAPRRWVGTMASIVVVNLAIALRGTSDRWTHGLAPMSDADRIATMLVAIVVVAGALFTMRTVQAPVIDEARWSRRLEERTARQSALGATVVLGLIGLLAGVLPGGIDVADDDPVRVEQLVDERAGSVDG